MKAIIKKEKSGKKKGFTLIELIIAIFIVSVIMVGVLTVSVSILNAYQKEKVVKTMKESIDFALSSIAKDVRMGKVESANSNSAIPSPRLEIIRNRGLGKVCYIRTAATLDVCFTSCTVCSGRRSLVDLSGMGLSFDNFSGFRNQKTLPAPPLDPTIRGWVEINLNIIPTGGISNINMSTDAINVQTIVSSRDYGW